MLLPYYQSAGTEAGIDEAGRGCLAGPVFAAAVILPSHFYHPLLNDSKKLTANQRNTLRGVIETQAIAWAVAWAGPEEIDVLNILQATYLAMHKAVDALSPKPRRLLVDGNRFKPFPGIVHTCIVGGDGRYASIAAASILAKTHRDECMIKLHALFPAYNWAQNKGYGTVDHRKAMEVLGSSEHHRKSFRWRSE
jgi:ribonuclease HII